MYALMDDINARAQTYTYTDTGGSLARICALLKALIFQ